MFKKSVKDFSASNYGMGDIMVRKCLSSEYRYINLTGNMSPYENQSQACV